MQIFEIIMLGALFLIVLYVGYKIGKFVGKKQQEERIPEIREVAIKQSRAVLGGQFSEQIAPYLPDFPFKPTEVRFLGKPIDFVVFKGMDEKNIEEVIFVEIKSGKNDLNNVQKSLKESIQNKKIRWHDYRIPKDLTKSK